MSSKLHDLTDQDRNGVMTAEELQHAIGLPALAQSIAQLVINTESEWYWKPGKWDALDALLGHSNSTPNENWLAEKQRIEQLCWWHEVAPKVGLPAQGRVWHLHPIGLVGAFKAPFRRNDLLVQRGQVTFDAEGNDMPGNLYFSRRLHWPGGASGVTLGRGYDMKHRTQASVYSDLIAAGVDQASAKNFSLGARLSGSAASDFVKENREKFGDITREAQRILFEDVVYPKYEIAARQQYSNHIAREGDVTPWSQLHDRIRDIAVDFTYQQGSIWSRQMPYIKGNDREALARYISETPELSQYETGRKRAKYLMVGGGN